MTQPLTAEVVPAVRLKQGSDRGPYIERRQLARNLGRSPTTLNKWEKWVIYHVPDYRRWYVPRAAFNLYQAWVLEQVNQFYESLPRSAPAAAIADYIQNNASQLTQEQYFNELAQTLQSDRSNRIEVA
ncbi:hypothetical protein [Lyngbya sp. CCY1209]|uniref:hypothetical protein n=1 Tax=Lyngbya sp. CCY1209 TaxID=2886103 RepID=UPI002D20AA56|nr:hypothetical protein [Lyngbya sp. CCY1209]MEB3886144.1 hypothetical protein [Lyngbya sp. CCY1209]